MHRLLIVCSWFCNLCHRHILEKQRRLPSRHVECFTTKGERRRKMYRDPMVIPHLKLLDMPFFSILAQIKATRSDDSENPIDKSESIQPTHNVSV